MAVIFPLQLFRQLSLCKKLILYAVTVHLNVNVTDLHFDIRKEMFLGMFVGDVHVHGDGTVLHLIRLEV